MRQAAERRNFVRIDMEDASCTDETLRLYRELREARLDNVGIVLQAYLRRTLDDIQALSDLTPNVRLCKGIYAEPEEIAYQGFDEVSENFVRALGALLEGGSYVGIATHDEWLIAEGERLVREAGDRRPATSSRCCSASGPSVQHSWWSRATACAFTSRTGRSGTPIRSAACRRTRRSPGTSPPTPSVGCFEPQRPLI